MDNTQPDIQPSEVSWAGLLAEEKESSYFTELLHAVDRERQSGYTVFPAKEKTFEAFRLTPFSEVKVVILGQDPYHGVKQAHGLSFSVQKGIEIPPSLKNIYQELSTDLGIALPSHGDLSTWATQGVFLLNSTLTVRAHAAASHVSFGWERFTNAVIKKLSDAGEGVVFMLWGAHAQRKIELIDTTRHLVLKAPHPSPLSAYRGFFGCQHFSKCNDYLKKTGRNEINWASLG
jgi:uracil-DNA glycosylase